MNNVPVVMINASDTSTQTGPPVFVGQVFSASFTSSFGDVTAVGTIKIQGSNANSSPGTKNPSIYVPPNSSFNDIPNATSAIAAGVGPAIIIGQCPFQYLRAVFTYTSGGSSTVTVLGTLASS
jgi:hypothetical protein